MTAINMPYLWPALLLAMVYAGLVGWMLGSFLLSGSGPPDGIGGVSDD